MIEKTKNEQLLVDNFHEIWEAWHSFIMPASDYDPETYLERLRELRDEINTEITLIKEEANLKK